MTTRHHSNKRKYVPHLPALQQLCAANYQCLLQLVPELDLSLGYQFTASGMQYHIQLLESAPYTSTLQLRQINSELPEYLQANMQVQLYHDAQMAEVVHSQHLASIQASYPYPNTHMHQPNEKEMINRFLHEWLRFCLNAQATTYSH